MTESKSEEGEAGTSLRLRLPTHPAPYTLLGYPSLPACLPKLLRLMKPTKSKKSMVALIVMNQMVIRVAPFLIFVSKFHSPHLFSDAV